MLASLAHLPVENVVEGFLTVMGRSPTSKEVDAFNDYFYDQWMSNQVVGLS